MQACDRDVCFSWFIVCEPDVGACFVFGVDLYLQPLQYARTSQSSKDAHNFYRILDEHKLSLPVAALQPWARWVTPKEEAGSKDVAEGRKKRFDTWFYVASVATIPTQIQSADSTETSQLIWITPQGIHPLILLSPVYACMLCVCCMYVCTCVCISALCMYVCMYVCNACVIVKCCCTFFLACFLLEPSSCLLIPPITKAVVGGSRECHVRSQCTIVLDTMIVASHWVLFYFCDPQKPYPGPHLVNFPWPHPPRLSCMNSLPAIRLQPCWIKPVVNRLNQYALVCYSTHIKCRSCYQEIQSSVPQNTPPDQTVSVDFNVIDW
jgi:hypothetical protein